MRSVAIIGAGPAGLTAARVLGEAGLRDILVIERNPQAGGLPRFCGHWGWGMQDFRRLWRGPRYAAELVSRARHAGVEVITDTTVTAIGPGGCLSLDTIQGPRTIEARTLLLATGIRETPRGPRLVGGARPWGVMSTGAFQEMVYAGSMRPFRRPLIVGTELVAFSALLTARHAGIKPVAMIEDGPRIVAPRPGDLVARHLFGVEVRCRTRLVEILGGDRVTGVIIERDGRQETLDCDGVLMTGRFQPESAMARASGLDIDPRTGGPSIDNLYRSSDPACFVAGNVIRPVEHSGRAAAEGAAAAHAILRDLRGSLSDAGRAVTISAGGALRYLVPQRLVPDGEAKRIEGRVSRATASRLRITYDGKAETGPRVRALPERRVAFALPPERLAGCRSVVIDLLPDGEA